MPEFSSKPLNDAKYHESFLVAVDELVVSEPHPDKEVVDFFVREMEAGVRIPPVDVKRLEDGKFTVIIGKARAIAAKIIESRLEVATPLRCRMYKYENILPIFKSIQHSKSGVDGLFFRVRAYKFLKLMGVADKEISRKCKRPMNDIIMCGILDSIPLHIKRLIINGLISPSLVVVVVKKIGMDTACKAITNASNDLSLWEGKRITPRMIMNHIV